MASSDKKDCRVAYCEEADDDTDSCITGTRTYAKTDEIPSPTKSRLADLDSDHLTSSASDDRSGASSRQGSYGGEVDANRSSTRTVIRDRDQETGGRDRQAKTSERKSSRAAADSERRKAERRSRQDGHPPTTTNGRKVRPSVEHSKTYPAPQPQLNTEENHIKAQQHHHANMSATQRPRANTRPASFSGIQPNQAPHPGMAPGWSGHHPYAGPPPPMGYSMGPRAPPMNLMYTSGGYMGPHSPMDPGSPYHEHAMPTNDHLKERFASRPPSAVGYQQEHSPVGYMPEEYMESPMPSISRQPSNGRRKDEDRKRMPPPNMIPQQRSVSAMPTSTGLFLPPGAGQRPQVRQNPSKVSSRQRRSYTDESEYDYRDVYNHERFQDISPQQSYDIRYDAQPRRRAAMYEEYDVIPASSRSRRASMYGGSIARREPPPQHDEDYILSEHFKETMTFKEAMAYQEAVSGGPKTPLTAAALRKASRRGVPSSHSTRSSESRDESEHRRSYTTGLTQSSSGVSEGITIKVGDTVVQVPPGTSIMVGSDPRGTRSISDRASTIYQIEDGRGRPDRKALPHRGRAPSQSNSQRGYPPKPYPYEQAYVDNNFF